MSDKKKIVNSCESDKQPLIVCHVKVAIKIVVVLKPLINVNLIALNIIWQAFYSTTYKKKSHVNECQKSHVNECPYDID